jgi:NTE family protein
MALRIRFYSLVVLLVFGVGLAGCATTPVSEPRNAPLRGISNEAQKQALGAADGIGETMVALSFSGGGLRAAAFSFGVLRGLDAIHGEDGRALLDDVMFISSVSGGSLTAAYYGLHGKEGLSSFREDVLLRDGEEHLRLSLFNPGNLRRLLTGGINDVDSLQSWLDHEVFHGATFADVARRGRPEVWINASDMYNRVAFPFSAGAFDVLCSDLYSLPVSVAVEASMAVPGYFSPVVLETYPDACVAPLPAGVRDAPRDPQSPLVLRAVAKAILDLREGQRRKYVKLLDGGVTDNFGLASILQSRLALGTPYGPLTEADAVRLRRMLYVVVDASSPPGGDWDQVIEGPTAADSLGAVVATVLGMNVRLAFDAFVAMTRAWQEDLVTYRCSLPLERVAQLRGDSRRWDCDDVEIIVIRLSFDDLDPEQARRLADVPTRLVLPEETIDELIAAGVEVATTHPLVRRFGEAGVRHERSGG